MKVEENFDLTLFNSYRVKAICNRAFFPVDEEDFISIYKAFGNTPKIVLGGGYNVILSKPYYHQDFIIIGKNFSEVRLTGPLLEAESGISLQSLSEFALAKNLTGLEMFFDIPSSLGGAVVMNAGAGGEEIKDVLIKVRYLDTEDLSIKEMHQKEVGFDYRNSYFQRRAGNIILKAWLLLREGDHEEIRKKMYDIRAARWAKQPKEYPNGGSVFKRPKGFYVGTMIEELGLKGLTVGGAQISKKHAGFIVNINNATGQDILELIKKVKEMVHQEFKIDLEVEQRII